MSRDFAMASENLVNEVTVLSPVPEVCCLTLVNSCFVAQSKYANLVVSHGLFPGSARGSWVNAAVDSGVRAGRDETAENMLSS